MKKTDRPERKDQINFTVDPDVREALDDIRAMMRPVPTISDAIRQAILEKRDSLRRKLAKAGG